MRSFAFCYTSARSLAASLIVTIYLLLIYSNSNSSSCSLYRSSPEPSPRLSCRIKPGWPLPNHTFGYSDDRIPAIVGDPAILGDDNRCLQASSRYTSYEGDAAPWHEISWGEVQGRCTSLVYGQLAAVNSEPAPLGRPSTENDQEFEPEASNGKARTAIVLRTWDDYEYTEQRIVRLRTLIAETALHSAGEYQVFLLVNIKNNDASLLESDTLYEETLKRTVPEEFRDMAVLYNEDVLNIWYPDVPEHKAQDQIYQALQIFSHRHQEFEYIWQLEMDVRMTGHAYLTLNNMIKWAKQQPRKNLWERNGAFYVPQLYNNSYANFAASIDSVIGEHGVWGPVPTTDFTPQGPTPPSRSETQWGVGEEPDLISFMPMIDPVGTSWIYEDMIHGFEDGNATPRRIAIVSMTRTSRRLLHLMSNAQRERGMWVASEGSAETFSLLHGLKAVTIPHPISFVQEMTPLEAEDTLNRGPPHSRAGGKDPLYLFTTNGWPDGPWGLASYWFAGDGGRNIWADYIDGACVPPMLLHPVKSD